jgi:hypothetical protein
MRIYLHDLSQFFRNLQTCFFRPGSYTARLIADFGAPRADSVGLNPLQNSSGSNLTICLVPLLFGMPLKMGMDRVDPMDHLPNPNFRANWGACADLQRVMGQWRRP